jgi:uncharacterized Zn ribbon protein
MAITCLAKRLGTVIRPIRITENEQEIDCQYEKIKGLEPFPFAKAN